MNDKPVCNYETFAKIYADSVDEKPIHVYYERPNTWSLLPASLANLEVLDVGCGSGWYAEKLITAAAKVTAIDLSPTMISLTKERLKGNATVLQANIENPLDFFSDEKFDIIIAPLVIHYVWDWQALFKEFARVLKPQGLFIFSTHQPHSVFQQFKLNCYFEKQIIHDHWPSLNIDVKYYHHTLHDLVDSLYQAGFIIERLLEPLPTEGLKENMAMYDAIAKQPWFLFIRAKKIN